VQTNRSRVTTVDKSPRMHESRDALWERTPLRDKEKGPLGVSKKALPEQSFNVMARALRCGKRGPCAWLPRRSHYTRKRAAHQFGASCTDALYAWRGAAIQDAPAATMLTNSVLAVLMRCMYAGRKVSSMHACNLVTFNCPQIAACKAAS